MASLSPPPTGARWVTHPVRISSGSRMDEGSAGATGAAAGATRLRALAHDEDERPLGGDAERVDRLHREGEPPVLRGVPMRAPTARLNRTPRVVTLARYRLPTVAGARRRAAIASRGVIASVTPCMDVRPSASASPSVKANEPPTVGVPVSAARGEVETARQRPAGERPGKRAQSSAETTVPRSQPASPSGHRARNTTAATGPAEPASEGTTTAFDCQARHAYAALPGCATINLSPTWTSARVLPCSAARGCPSVSSDECDPSWGLVLSVP